MVSADLQAASDLLLHSHCKALWEGILLSMQLGPDLSEIVMDSMGPQYLYYPDGREVLTTRGILMGLPLTWITLSLMHIFWVCEAHY